MLNIIGGQTRQVVRRVNMTAERHVITSTCGRYTRDVWLMRSRIDRAHRLSVFLDAELYLGDMNSVPVIQELLERGAVPPTTCVFVSHMSGAARHDDYTCNDRYGRFIAEDVVRWAKERNSQISRDDNLICGVSLSGLAAMYAALRHPQVFSYALCQSASFWWLENNEATLPATRGKFWLSVGDRETATNVSHPPTGLLQRVSQIEGVRSAAGRLEALGATVRYTMFSGGHAPGPWRDELAPALTWLIGGSA
jgi:enterochelin esterase-like enzyme